MRTVFRQITVVAMDDGHGSVPFVADVVTDGSTIVEVGSGVEDRPGDVVIDGTDRLLMPGLINAHTHSWEALFRGRYDNLPLELWMLLSYPILGVEPLSAELIRLRTLLVAVESLRNGVTCLLDDVIEMPGQSLEALGAVFGAYDEAGIRASISGNMVDRRYIDTLPFVDELIPAPLLAEARRVAPPTAKDFIEFATEAIARFDGGPDARLRYAIAPSGPQRCTDELFQAADDLSRHHDTTFHVHVLETKVQAVTGQELYGETLVAHLDAIGVLSERLTIAHGIWLTDDDIGLMATSGASVAHNPISNQKLGAGIVAWRKLLDAGVNVALGTDGLSSNDSARMFDVMKSAALLQKVTTPDYTTWPTATEVLHAATRGGAHSVRAENRLGAVEAGRAADLVVLDMTTASFTPRNDIANHLVYLENGSSIELVMVDGEVVVRDGRCTRIDEHAILAELRAAAPELLQRHAEIEKTNAALLPHVAEIHRRCCATPIGLNRYAGDEQAWVR